ncbi:radical SAM protein [Candidatus Woesearchaeota archaeon]|nr:radical SAM protein [Candidatus Woesearchaeota archaeon]MBW2994216.1 radical SAM protein [Candidatus Woesearchaeota archaeon]
MNTIEQANKVFLENWGKEVYYGRCIFLSWYCERGTCKFCFRSTIHHKVKHAKTAKRSMASILVEAVLAKNLGWNIEFLTGGYGIYPFEELLEIIRNVNKIIGRKVWVNLGAFNAEQLERLKPYVEGICASIETVEEKLHDELCPDKPIQPYSDMLKIAKEMGFKTSIAIIIGLGEKNIEMLHKFIEEHQLDRITFYALKPVKGTIFENKEGPTSEYYAEWIAKTRIRFPKLDIIAGTTARRYKEAELLFKTGANAITKFPATKLFGTEQARVVEAGAEQAGRVFKGTLTVLPDIDWGAEVDKLELDDKLKEQLKEKLSQYLKSMENNINDK